MVSTAPCNRHDFLSLMKHSKDEKSTSISKAGKTKQTGGHWVRVRVRVGAGVIYGVKVIREPRPILVFHSLVTKIFTLKSPSSNTYTQLIFDCL